MTKHKRDTGKEYKFAAPGIVAGALFIVVVYWITGTAAQWWCWLGALVVASIVHGVMGIEPETRAKIKETTVFVKQPKE